MPGTGPVTPEPSKIFGAICWTKAGERGAGSSSIECAAVANAPHAHIFCDLHQKVPSESALASASSMRSPLSSRTNSKIFWASLIVHDRIPVPSGVSAETMDDERRSIESDGPDGDCIVVYCGTNNCGAIYWMGRRVWSMWAPISPVEFVTLLQTNNVRA